MVPTNFPPPFRRWLLVLKPRPIPHNSYFLNLNKLLIKLYTSQGVIIGLGKLVVALPPLLFCCATVSLRLVVELAPLLPLLASAAFLLPCQSVGCVLKTIPPSTFSPPSIPPHCLRCYGWLLRRIRSLPPPSSNA